MKKTYRGWLGIYASAKFEAEIETDGKSEEEILGEFLDTCEPISSLCWQCSENVETDFVIDDHSTDISFDGLEELENEDN